MKKTLITLLALSGIAMGASTVTGLTSYDGAASNTTITLGTDVLKITISGGKAWDIDLPSYATWTNTSALETMNGDLGTTIGSTDIVSYIPVGAGPGGSWTDLTLDINSIAAGEEIVMYTLASAYNSQLGAFAVSGLEEGYSVEYATFDGTGFSSTTSFSTSTYESSKPTELNQTLIRITGTVTESDIVLSARGNNKNMWSMLAYAPYTVTPPTPGDNVPEPTTATLSLLALAGLAARRRRK